MSTAVLRRSLGVAGILLVVGVATATRISAELDRPFGTDEADYVRALSYGFLANYLGTREQSGIAFLREVVDEYRKTGWARPFQRDWEKGDAAGLRHYHPPVGLYPVAVLTTFTRNEYTLRLVPVALGVLACLSAALLAWVLAPTHSGPAAFVTGAIVAASPYHIVASVDLSYHVAFTVFSTAVLTTLALTLRRESRFWWHVSSVLLALALLTIPYWLLLVPGYLWTGYRVFGRGRLREGLYGLLTMAAAAVVAWPAFIIEAGVVKPILMYGGIIVRPLPGGAWGSWMSDLASSHMVLACLAAVAVFGVVTRRVRVEGATPTVLFCVAFVLLNLRVAHMKPLYGADLIGPLAALIAALVVTLDLRVSRVATAAAAASLALAAAQPSRSASVPDWRQSLEDMGNQLRGVTALVTPRPTGAILKYYLPETRWVLDSGHPDDLSRIRQLTETGELATVVQWGGTFEPGGAAQSLVEHARSKTFTVVSTPVRIYTLRDAPERP